jgi:hypothetical protein
MHGRRRGPGFLDIGLTCPLTGPAVMRTGAGGCRSQRRRSGPGSAVSCAAGRGCRRGASRRDHACFEQGGEVVDPDVGQQALIPGGPASGGSGHPRTIPLWRPRRSWSWPPAAGDPSPQAVRLTGAGVAASASPPPSPIARPPLQPGRVRRRPRRARLADPVLTRAGPTSRRGSPQASRRLWRDRSPEQVFEAMASRHVETIEVSSRICSLHLLIGPCSSTTSASRRAISRRC